MAHLRGRRFGVWVDIIGSNPTSINASILELSLEGEEKQ